MQAELGLLQEFSNKGIAGFDFDQIRKLAKDQTVRPKFASALGQYMFDPSVYRKARYKNKAFDGYIRQILESEDKEGVNAVLEAALDKKEVALDDLFIMIGIAAEKSGGLIGVDTNSGEVPTEKKSALDRLKSLFDWTKDKPGESTQAIRNYSTRIQ